MQSFLLQVPRLKVLKDLINNMVKRVEEKIGQKDADEVTHDLKDYELGANLYSERDVQSQMSTLLRLLT